MANATQVGFIVIGLIFGYILLGYLLGGIQGAFIGGNRIFTKLYAMV